MKRQLVWVLVIIFVIAVSSLIIFSSNNKDDIILAGKDKIKLQLQWFDQSQFAGFYVAKYKNFYNEEGISVEIIPGGYNTIPIQNVLSGRADIGLVTGNKLLIAKSDGHDLKAFGTVFNQSIACFMSKSEKKVHVPQDLIGKTVGVYRGYDTEHLLMCLLNKHKIPINEVKIVDAGPITAFINNDIDVFPSYIINEPIKMEELNISVDLLKPEDFGVLFYSDTFFTTGAFWKKNRDLLKRFMRASAKGWDYASKNIDESIKIMYETRSNLTPHATQIHQRKMLERSCEYLRDGENKQMFYMRLDRWNEMEDLLFRANILKTKDNVNELCDFNLIKELENEN